MKLPAWIATAVSAIVLPACDYFNLKAIQPGVTTQAETRSRMGEPGFIHPNEDGSVTWEYSRQPQGIHCYMIRFGRDLVVSQVEQVLTDEHFAQVQHGMRPEEIRRRFGAPATRQVFANLGEEIWEWRIEGLPPTEETYFSVSFELASGGVKKWGKRVQLKG